MEWLNQPTQVPLQIEGGGYPENPNEPPPVTTHIRPRSSNGSVTRLREPKRMREGLTEIRVTQDMDTQSGSEVGPPPSYPATTEASTPRAEGSFKNDQPEKISLHFCQKMNMVGMSESLILFGKHCQKGWIFKRVLCTRFLIK